MVLESKSMVVVEAPSNLGLKDTGVDRAAQVLLSAGIADQLHAKRDGCVKASPYNVTRDPKTGILNTQAIIKYTFDLADAVKTVLDSGEFPLVLGGDCSILLGNLLALRRRRGRFGLFFVDGHADFYQPEANINGEAASSELAFATGRGPKELTSFEGNCPLVFDEDVAVFGLRDLEEQQKYNSQMLPSTMLAQNLTLIRETGLEKASKQAIKHLTRSDLTGFWVHLDVDVLSDDIMPAVDYHQPDGFSWDELTSTLKTIWRSQKAVGLDVTIYNPCYDKNHLAAAGLVQALAKSLKI